MTLTEEVYPSSHLLPTIFVDDILVDCDLVQAILAVNSAFLNSDDMSEYIRAVELIITFSKFENEDYHPEKNPETGEIFEIEAFCVGIDPAFTDSEFINIYDIHQQKMLEAVPLKVISDF